MPHPQQVNDTSDRGRSYRSHRSACPLPEVRGRHDTVAVRLNLVPVGSADTCLLARHFSTGPPGCVVHVGTKLQALVYDILPSTTAVFSYAIGSRKLSANEQFFCWCSNSGKFVTNNSNKTRCIIYSQPPTKFTPAQIKPQSFESKRNSFFFFFFFTRG